MMDLAQSGQTPLNPVIQRPAGWESQGPVLANAQTLRGSPSAARDHHARLWAQLRENLQTQLCKATDPAPRLEFPYDLTIILLGSFQKNMMV